MPFLRPPQLEYLHRASVALASAWFLERGYHVSVPTEPAPYDLIVESDDGLVRIQVKSTITQEAGRWAVRISRKEYAPGVANSGGARRQCVYREGEIDFFFIVTADGSQFLIPLSSTSGAGHLTLDSKYSAYKVQ